MQANNNIQTSNSISSIDDISGCIPGNTIIKTQAKYNNGIIEGMSSKLDPENWILKKSPNYLSSWNCVAPKLDKIFTMTELNL